MIPLVGSLTTNLEKLSRTNKDESGTAFELQCHRCNTEKRLASEQSSLPQVKAEENTCIVSIGTAHTAAQNHETGKGGKHCGTSKNDCLNLDIQKLRPHDSLLPGSVPKLPCNHLLGCLEGSYLQWSRIEKSSDVSATRCRCVFAAQQKAQISNTGFPTIVFFGVDSDQDGLPKRGNPRFFKVNAGWLILEYEIEDQ